MFKRTTWNGFSENPFWVSQRWEGPKWGSSFEGRHRVIKLVWKDLTKLFRMIIPPPTPCFCWLQMKHEFLGQCFDDGLLGAFSGEAQGVALGYWLWSYCTCKTTDLVDFMVLWLLQCGFFTAPIEQWSPNFLSPRIGFLEDSFSTDRGGGGGIVWGWFKCITFIMHFML